LPAPDERDGLATIRRDLKGGIVLAAIAASVVIFISVDSRSHSVSDTFYGIVVPEAIVLVVAVAAWALVQRGVPRTR